MSSPQSLYLRDLRTGQNMTQHMSRERQARAGEWLVYLLSLLATLTRTIWSPAPVTPVPRDLVPSSGLCGYLHTHAYTYTEAHICI